MQRHKNSYFIKSNETQYEALMSMPLKIEVKFKLKKSKNGN